MNFTTLKIIISQNKVGASHSNRSPRRGSRKSHLPIIEAIAATKSRHWPDLFYAHHQSPAQTAGLSLLLVKERWSPKEHKGAARKEGHWESKNDKSSLLRV